MIDVTPLYISLQEKSNASYNLACWLHSHCMMWIPLSVASDTSHHSQSVSGHPGPLTPHASCHLHRSHLTFGQRSAQVCSQVRFLNCQYPSNLQE